MKKHISNQNKIIEKQQDTINNLVPKIGNTVNINMFLNDRCKNALNISDFVKSLEFKEDDLSNKYIIIFDKRIK